MNQFLNIVHLADRPDRFTQLVGELEIQSLKACLWPGIREPVDPRIGIALAHSQIIRYAKEQGFQSIIIAEDDIKFTAPGAFDFYLQQKPDDYDLYLGGILYGNNSLLVCTFLIGFQIAG